MTQIETLKNEFFFVKASRVVEAEQDFRSEATQTTIHVIGAASLKGEISCLISDYADIFRT